MSGPTYTVNDIAQLLETVVSGIRTGDNGDDRVFSLEQVAERTGFAVDTLKADCRADLVEHTHRGRTIGMTSRQIALLIQRHAKGGDLAGRSAPSAAEQVRASSMRAANRRPGRAA